MAYELELDDKKSILDSHIRRLSYEKYNASISLLVEQSSIAIDQSTVNSLNLKISDLQGKIEKLETMKSELDSQEE